MVLLAVRQSPSPPSSPSSSAYSVQVTRLWVVHTGAYGFYRSARLPPVAANLLRTSPSADDEGESGWQQRTARRGRPRRQCGCQRALLLLPSEVQSNAHLVDVDLRRLCCTVECEERIEAGKEEQEEQLQVEEGEEERKGGPQPGGLLDAASTASAASSSSASSSSSSTAFPVRYRRVYGQLMSAALYRAPQQGSSAQQSHTHHWRVLALCGMESGHLLLLDLTSQLHSAASATPKERRTNTARTSQSPSLLSLDSPSALASSTRVAQLQLHSQPSQSQQPPSPLCSSTHVHLSARATVQRRRWSAV